MATTTVRPPTARARELGVELRKIRRSAGYNGSELARRIGWSASTVSRMESGARGISEVNVAIYLTSCGLKRKDMHELLALAGESDEPSWLRSHGRQLPDELRSLVILENTSDAIASYEPLYVPGLLQTEDYIREIFRSAGIIEDDKRIDVLVRARLERQQSLRATRPSRFAFFIHENAVRSMVGGSRLMHDQLLHLLFATSQPRTTIRIVPAAAKPVAVLGGSFRLMDSAEHSAVGYEEGRTTSLFLEDPGDVAVYRKALGTLANVALDGAQSREWLARVASEYDQVEAPADVPRVARIGAAEE